MKSQIRNCEFYADLLCRMIRSNMLTPKLSSSGTVRDIERFNISLSRRGPTFLTKDLPLLGKAFDRALEVGTLVTPRPFERMAGGKVPAFMQEAFLHVFTRSGVLLDKPEVEAVRLIRQVCYLAYKLETPIDTELVNQKVREFVSVDESLEGVIGNRFYDRVLAVTATILQDVFWDFDPKDISPRHGPGAVATGEKGDEKWEFSRLYHSIHQSYPYYDYFIAGGRDELLDRIHWYRGLQRTDYGVAKLVPVPKDSRGPRLISAEPLEFQYIQQGLGRAIVRHIEEHSCASGQVNFRDQSINQSIAKSSSIDGFYATVDLKDASDRVSLDLVREVFPKTLLPYLLNTRSSYTRLPDGSLHRLRKFAPMGSALCFPVESILFWALASAGIAISYGIPWQVAGQHVYVYGDDIIVFAGHLPAVVEVFSGVGLVVNIEKTYSKGEFRESCGMDAFRGENVTPLRLRTPWSGSRFDGAAYASYVSLYNAMYARYPAAQAFLMEKIEALYGKMPFVTSTSSLIGIIVPSQCQAALSNVAKGIPRRYNRRYQRIEFSGLAIVSQARNTKLDGWQRLLKDLLTSGWAQGSDGVIRPKSGDPSKVVVLRSTKLKRKWSIV